METNYLDELIVQYTIVMYDGICGFCDASVQFILDRKPLSTLRFVSFQSEIGKQLLQKYNYTSTPETIICIENGVFFKKSAAIFAIAKYIQGPYRYAQYLRWLPKFITDTGYKVIAKYRYQLMGKKQHCRLLTSNEQRYFLE